VQRAFFHGVNVGGMVLATLAALLSCGGCSRPVATAAAGPFDFAGERVCWEFLDDEMRSRLDALFEGTTGPPLVVIHSSATDTGSVAAFEDHFSRVKRDPMGMPWHFLIGNGRGMAAGRIHFSRRLAASAAAPERIELALVGDFNRRPPERSQLAALDEILDYLAAKAGPPRVRLHREIANSPRGCPGARFPVEDLRRAFPD
jgi:hypothetical protein